jgi:hypothetical protein
MYKILVICWFLVLIIFIKNNVIAQNNNNRLSEVSKDSTNKNIPDSLKKEKKYKKPFKFTVEGVRFGFDIFYPIFDNFVVPSRPFNADKPLEQYRIKQRYETSVDVSFAQNRFFAVFDYGYSRVERYRKGLFFTGFTYKNTGSYFRIGADYNFMHRNFKDEAMTIGFRYGSARFDHEFEFLGANQAWGYPTPRNVQVGDQIVTVDERFVGSIKESNLTASWVELTLGLRVNVWKQLFFGYHARLMIRSNIKGEDRLLANDLPGFGTTNRNARLIFNYFVAYRLAFKTKPLLPSKVQKVIEETTQK